MNTKYNKKCGYRSDRWSIGEKAFRKINKNKKSEEEEYEVESECKRKEERKAYLHAAGTTTNHGKPLIHIANITFCKGFHKSTSQNTIVAIEKEIN